MGDELDGMIEVAVERYKRLFGVTLGEDWLKHSSHVYSVLRLVDFELRLREANGWKEKLKVDKAKLDLDTQRYQKF